MKRRHVLFALLILAIVGIALLLLLARATPQRNQPNQTARFQGYQVGALSRPGPWRILLFYEHDSGSGSLSSRISEIVLHRRDKYEIYSDWIVQ